MGKAPLTQGDDEDIDGFSELEGQDEGEGDAAAATRLEQGHDRIFRPATSLQEVDCTAEHWAHIWKPNGGGQCC